MLGALLIAPIAAHRQPLAADEHKGVARQVDGGRQYLHGGVEHGRIDELAARRRIRGQAQPAGGRPFPHAASFDTSKRRPELVAECAQSPIKRFAIEVVALLPSGVLGMQPISERVRVRAGAEKPSAGVDEASIRVRRREQPAVAGAG